MIRCERATVERSGRVVVEAVTLAVVPGQAAALIGRSGAGKSSLLAAAATASPLHAGDILIGGQSVRRAAEAVRRLIGYVPVRLPAWPGVRADEFLEAFAVAAGLRGKPLTAAVSKALGMAGLAGNSHAPVDTLSSGHAKRLLVARSLLHDPQVLLLDDPFGGLDPIERRDIERLIGDAHLMGRTVLAAIDAADVPSCFTQLAVLDEGRLVASGPAEPASFAAGRTWECAIVCRGAAEAAVRVLVTIVADARAVDGDTVAFTLDAAKGTLADAVAALVRAGIAVEQAGFDPPWPAQLLR
ncbi:MAG: ABC transporter ATP-binding protein [Planctomycetia bacterium]|nr:ABC transporter ATP-binding protein [Planctomycetia bacterium]